MPAPFSFSRRGQSTRAAGVDGSLKLFEQSCAELKLSWWRDLFKNLDLGTCSSNNLSASVFFYHIYTIGLGTMYALVCSYYKGKYCIQPMCICCLEKQRLRTEILGPEIFTLLWHKGLSSSLPGQHSRIEGEYTPDKGKFRQPASQPTVSPHLSPLSSVLAGTKGPRPGK